MNLLVLGGTKFLGYHLVKTAQQRGHEITIFHRGLTNPDIHTGVEHLYGDRDGQLDALQGRKWDAVIDTSGYLPRLVRASGMLLADLVDIYVYVSSISVYRDLSNPDVNENSELLTLPEENIEDIPNYYGALKAHCEQELARIMPNRILIIRPGLLVGPLDSSDRFTYWPLRIDRGGEVLAPGNPEDPVQFIDARDLAEWTLNMTESRKTGIYQATGPDEVMTMREMLERGRDILGNDARFTWVDEKFLMNHDVKAWTEMPLWLPNAGEYKQYRGMNQSDCRKATAAGLTFRPLSETIRDIVEWNSTRPTGKELKAGLSPDREISLLALWHEYQGKNGL